MNNLTLEECCLYIWADGATVLYHLANIWELFGILRATRERSYYLHALCRLLCLAGLKRGRCVFVSYAAAARLVLHWQEHVEGLLSRIISTFLYLLFSEMYSQLWP